VVINFVTFSMICYIRMTLPQIQFLRDNIEAGLQADDYYNSVHLERATNFGDQMGEQEFEEHLERTSHVDNRDWIYAQTHPIETDPALVTDELISQADELRAEFLGMRGSEDLPEPRDKSVIGCTKEVIELCKFSRSLDIERWLLEKITALHKIQTAAIKARTAELRAQKTLTEERNAAMKKRNDLLAERKNLLAEQKVLLVERKNLLETTPDGS
jgi:hypothetical protein